MVAMETVFIPSDMSTIGMVGMHTMAIAGLSFPLAKAISMSIASIAISMMTMESLNPPIH